MARREYKITLPFNVVFLLWIMVGYAWVKLLLLFVPLCVAIPEEEVSALHNIYDALNGDNWNNNNGWKDAAVNPCDWFGITCSTSRAFVTSFGLNNNGLVGQLPLDFNAFRSLNSLYVKVYMEETVE